MQCESFTHEATLLLLESSGDCNAVPDQATRVNAQISSVNQTGCSPFKVKDSPEDVLSLTVEF